jgi:16S rRNA (guanine(966)-N(2))-methyltransferase RsmD
LRETLFNILQPVIEGARFLDLCAGSGAVGIEALSRGAGFCAFVDRAASMSALVRANLDHCQVPEADYRVATSDALAFLCAQDQTWDLVYYDPPYETNYEPVLGYLGVNAGTRLTPDARLLVEHRRDLALAEEIGDLTLIRRIKQGETWVTIYQSRF